MDGVEIHGLKLRVSLFMNKKELVKCRMFVKGLETNDLELIKDKLQKKLGFEIN